MAAAAPPVSCLNDFTVVVLCETAIDRLGRTSELGPQGALLVRTTHLPVWALCTDYDGATIDLDGRDEVVRATAELDALVKAGHAVRLPGERFVSVMGAGRARTLLSAVA